MVNLSLSRVSLNRSWWRFCAWVALGNVHELPVLHSFVLQSFQTPVYVSDSD